MKYKSSKQLERHLRGVSNHYRIDILFAIRDNEGITLDGLVAAVNANQKTLSEHTVRLASAGLINKNYHGRMVEHRLSPYGKVMVNFLQQFREL